MARGGMGRIFEGEDLSLKRQVAVKVSAMKKGRVDPRFLREAQVLARLAHPNIVPVYSLGEDDWGRPCYSMKLVRGKTLQAILDAQLEGDEEALRGYGRERLLGVFLKICDALSFAHAQGFLHRDVKPENVMVGEFGEVLVMDWGLAKFRSDPAWEEEPERGLEIEEPAPGATLDGEVLGTPGYMSPEQARGLVNELDERSDIFCLGGVLHAILTLYPPIEGDTLLEVLIKTKRGEISGRMAGAGQKAPPALQAVTSKALALNPADRYQSVSEMAAEIESYRDGFATRAEEATLMRLLLLFVKRHVAVSAMAAILALGALVFTVRLGASERLARENASVAIVEREAAQNEAARALVAPVEIAQRDFDGEEMQHMLAEVPEELRRQPWGYLNSRLDTAAMTAEIADRSPIAASIPHPEQPNVFLTLQENGWIRSFDSISGEFHDLFRRESFQPSRVILAVSKDAQKVAVVRHTASGSHLEVRLLPGGDVVFEADSSSRYAQMFFNPAANLLFCGTRTKNKVWTQSEVWDLREGRKKVDLEGFLFWEESGPTPKLYCVSKGNPIVEVDLSTGVALAAPPKAELLEVVRHLNFSFGHVLRSDSKVVFTVGGGQPLLRQISTLTGGVKFESLLAQGQVRGVDWNPSPPLVATLVQRSKQCAVLQLWQPENGALCKAVFVLGGEGEAALTIHPLSGRIAVFQGARIKVWSTREPAPLTKVEGLQASAPWFSFVPNSPLALQTNSEGWLALADLSPSEAGGHSPLFLSDHPGIPSVSADGSTLLFARKWGAPEDLSDAVRVFLRSGETYMERASFFQARLEGEGKRRLLSPDGSVFVSKENGAPAFFDTTSGKLIRPIKMEEKIAVFFGPNAAWLDARRFMNVFDVQDDRPWADPTTKADAIQIWDIRSGEPVLKMFAPKVGLLCASPDGLTVAEAGTDLRLRFRSSSTLQVEREFRVHDGPIRCMAWHPTLPVLVTGADDSAVRVWDTRSGRLLHEFDGIQFPRQLFVSPDGRKLCVIRKMAAEAVVFELPVFVDREKSSRPPSARR